MTAEETEAASYATSWADEIRQPRCNWTSGELEAGEYDESISLEDRIASLLAAGVEYNEVAASHWHSRPWERESLDAQPQRKVSGMMSEVFGMLSAAAAKSKVQNTWRQLFSPVMTQTVMFVLLAVAVANGEHIVVVDIKGAFLYAMLLPDEMVYCRPPKGFENHPRFKGSSCGCARRCTASNRRLVGDSSTWSPCSSATV